MHLSVDKRRINSFLTLYFLTLKDFMSELSQKHSSTRLDYKFSCKEIEFLDTLVSIDQQNKLQTTLSQKSSDHQNFLNATSYSLKKIIPYR